MHLIHLCSLAAVTCLLCQRLPSSLNNIFSRILLGSLSPPHTQTGESFINPSCGCSASHTVSTFFCHSQLFSDFPNTAVFLSSPLSPPLPPFLPLLIAVSQLSSATLLPLKHWVLKPVGALPWHVCVIFLITLRSSLG